VPAGRGWGLGIAGLLVALALLAGSAVLFRFDPTQHGFYPRCQLYRMTGLQCPGCGGLRAWHALLHGQVNEAFKLNPLFVLALPMGGAWIATWSLRKRRAPTARLTVPTPWIWAGVAVIIVFGVVRNLPGFPGGALTP
jgi:hypothetical protein